MVKMQRYSIKECSFSLLWLELGLMVALRWPPFVNNAERNVNLVCRYIISLLLCLNICIVHAEAPIILRPVDLPQNLASLGAAEAIVDSTGDSDSPELIARGWWLRHDPETMYKCIEALRDLVKDQEVPYDVSLVSSVTFVTNTGNQGVLGFRWVICMGIFWSYTGL